MENQPGYVAIFCWKCNAQNNAARTQVCRVCGCYLRSDAETSMKALYVGSVTDHPGFKSWIIGGIIFVAVVSGLTYLAIQKKSSAGPTVAAAITKPQDKKPDVELPANSWYNQSWWSYVRKHPSPEQIIKKAGEVGGKSLAPQIAKTFAGSGRIAVARGNCITEGCGVQQAMRSALEKQTMAGMGYGQQTTAVKPPEPDPKPAARSNEDFLGYQYMDIGVLEVAAKIPDKTMKRATAIIAPGSDAASTEVREVFNGYAGSKITKYLDSTGKLIRAEKTTKSFDEMLATRDELEAMWKTGYSQNKDFVLKAVEKLNDSTVFAVASKNVNGEHETHYFDSVSGFLVKMEAKGMVVYFDDYRPYERAMMPYKFYYRKAENGVYLWIRADIDSWKIGDFIDEAIFEEEKIDPKYFPQSRFN